jgi:uncharacterized RDD family membrane protein YckC
MEQDVAILSPEKTILTYRLAGLGSRITAHVIDLLIVTATTIGIVIGVSYVVARFDEGIATAIILVTSVLWPFLYFILLEGLWNGQTIGKKASGLRVRMIDGTPVTFAAALARNLMRPADMMPGPYFVGLLAMFTNPRSQRVGDLIAGTIVCYEKRPTAVFAAAPHTVGLHPLESHVGELRGMTIEEYNALRRFADRFPELSTNVQNKLIEEVWTPIAQRREVPALTNVHAIYLAEAVVMKYGRQHGLL